MKLKAVIITILFFLLTIAVPSYGEAAERINGTDRFKTAVEISKKGWHSTENVVLANGLNFPDALSGAPLAYALDAPILLVNKDTIPQATLDEIIKLKPKNIYLLGGTSVISKNIADRLGKDYNVIRVSGSSRYSTAAEIGKELRKKSIQDTAVVVYGQNYPDALGIGGIASENGWPILFTDSNTLHNDTKKSLADWGIKKVLVIGGTGVIENSVAEEIDNMDISVERIAGANRIETSIKVAKKFYPATKGVIISTGFNFPDALSGGPLAGKLGRPIILVNPTSASTDVLGYIDASGAEDVTILGGTSAVKDTVRDEISSVINQEPQQDSAKTLNIYDLFRMETASDLTPAQRLKAHQDSMEITDTKYYILQLNREFDKYIQGTFSWDYRNKANRSNFLAFRKVSYWYDNAFLPTDKLYERMHQIVKEHQLIITPSFNYNIEDIFIHPTRGGYVVSQILSLKYTSANGAKIAGWEPNKWYSVRYEVEFDYPSITPSWPLWNYGDYGWLAAGKGYRIGTFK